MTIAYESLLFASEAHKDQKRKFSENPYADHLAKVAGIAVAACPGNMHHDAMAAVALLYLCVEDYGFTVDTLFEKFGLAKKNTHMGKFAFDQANADGFASGLRSPLSATPSGPYVEAVGKHGNGCPACGHQGVLEQWMTGYHDEQSSRMGVKAFNPA